MSDLLFKSIEIQRFRAFKQLRIPRLGRVNLIVGKNNTGKTSVLEALQLYADRDKISQVWSILERRGEIKRQAEDQALHLRERLSALSYIYYGRSPIHVGNRPGPLVIKPLEDESQDVTIDLRWYIEEKNENENNPILVPAKNTESNLGRALVPAFHVTVGKKRDGIYRIDSNFQFYLDLRPDLVNYEFVGSAGLDGEAIGYLWEPIALTEAEDRVLEALRIIEPEVERISVISAPEYMEHSRAIVKLANFDKPVPLGSLGEGMNRIFGMTLALVSARDGLLLIDEVENGLHYSAQVDFWRLVLKVAKELNVQVFATTHSWDCIQAFQQATQEDKQEEGVLIRLGRKKQDIVATIYDESELAAVTREQIEVR